MARLLFVCTANICRSPAAEAIARARFSDRHQYGSAGFLFDGRPIEPDMAKALAGIGIAAGSHRSRILDPGLLKSADLVLTMEARHVQDIAVMDQECFAHTLPLAEAADRLRTAPSAVDDFVKGLADRDPMHYFDSRWNVEDPYKRSRRKYRQAVARISDLVDAVVTNLR